MRPARPVAQLEDGARRTMGGDGIVEQRIVRAGPEILDVSPACVKPAGEEVRVIGRIGSHRPVMSPVCTSITDYGAHTGHLNLHATAGCDLAIVVGLVAPICAFPVRLVSGRCSPARASSVTFWSLESSVSITLLPGFGSLLRWRFHG